MIFFKHFYACEALCDLKGATLSHKWTYEYVGMDLVAKQRAGDDQWLILTNNPPCCVAALHAGLFFATVGLEIVLSASSLAGLFLYYCRSALKEAPVGAWFWWTDTRTRGSLLMLLMTHSDTFSDLNYHKSNIVIIIHTNKSQKATKLTQKSKFHNLSREVHFWKHTHTY